MKGFFVTGTDTGVGKTRVACALLRALRARDIDAGAMKPIETGVGPAGPLDALALREAAGGVDPLEDVCPQAFALPAAPSVAAAAAGGKVSLDAVLASYRRVRARHDCVIVEGAGGLLVPICEGVSMAELARRLELPLLVVARARLGTINHTLLTLEAAVGRGLPVAGVVISHVEPELPAADARNLAALRAALGPGLVGELPHLPPEAPLPPGALELERLLEGPPV